jgi:hypothetical protein
MIIVDDGTVRPLAMPVNETLKALISMGKTEISMRSL